MIEQLKFDFYPNPEELEGWKQVTINERVKKNPKFVGYDIDNNFIIDFEVINRHNVYLIKRFIFSKNSNRPQAIIISAESPPGVNINNNFFEYTRISKKCFNYLKKIAFAIYKDRDNINNGFKKPNRNNDRLSLDIPSD
ncbi:MAG: hypothetical protein KatS3mg095_0846 [Candidatus Parcubacteria bacterium]|nr:MAG: hypothetical protein KatS3mg095_0846 [Candidatus Parcubacteria bacterium]